MMSSLVAFNNLKAIIPASFLTLSWVPFASFSMGLNAVKWMISKKVFLKLDNFAYSAYLRTCLFIFENVSAVQINFHGDYEDLIKKQESAIILSNHQSDTDWVVILMLASRQKKGEHMLRVMVKDAIHYTPLFGWYIYQHGFIYVRRFKKFVLLPVKRQIDYLANLGEPFWLLIFPEGTRFSPKKQTVIEASQGYCRNNGYSPFESVLFPRANGLLLSLDHLRKNLDAVYDITIAYGQARNPSRLRHAPNMFEFVCGSQSYRTIHFYIRRFSITEIPKESKAIKKWLADQYCIKNQMLNDFYNGKDFPDPVLIDAKHLPLTRTFLPAFFFFSSILGAVYFTIPRRIFLFTVASSPFLILWLKIRNAF